MFHTDTWCSFVSAVSQPHETESFRGTGFHILFDNDYTVSVQWGPGSYCDNHWVSTFEKRAVWTSETAEIALFSPSRKFVSCGDDDDVRGWQTKEQVAAFIRWAAGIEKGRVVKLVPQF